MMRKIAAWPWAPFLLGIYPIVHLYSVNVDRVNPPEILWPLGIGLGLSVLLTATISLLCRSFRKGALATCALLLSSYLICGSADTFFPWMIGVAHPVWDFVFTLVPFVIAAGTYVLLRTCDDLSSWMLTVNVVVAVLLILPIARGVLNRDKIIQGIEVAHAPAKGFSDNSHWPDVYYIILDGYARADVLKNDMGYDNGPFIDFLRRRGFYVADRSRSNYAYTYLSLASSLNMNYINDLNSVPDQQTECLRRIRENKLMAQFHAHGYQTIHIASGWSVTDYSHGADVVMSSHHLNEFHGLLLRASLLRMIGDKSMAHAGRERLLYLLTELGKVADRPQATFTFAHLLCPHPPYVFDRQGRLPTPRTYASRPKGSRDWYPKERYIDQLDYINHRVETMIDEILKRSSTPPIIVLQGDHGAACDGTSANPTDLMVRERMGILNAYYVPDAIRKQLYPTISPVNSFRIILSSLFQIALPLLPDKNYYSGPMDDTPYRFKEVR